MNHEQTFRRRGPRSGVPRTGELLAPRARLHVLRALVSGGYVHHFVGKDGYGDHELACALGLTSMDEVELEFDAKDARRKLLDLYTQAEEGAARDAASCEVLDLNVLALRDTAGLSPLAGELLALAVLIKTTPAMCTLNSIIGPLNTMKLHQVLAVMLDADINAVRAELAPTAALHQSGLLQVDRLDTFPIGLKLDLISADFAERIISERCEPLDLLRGCVTVSPTPELGMGDFGHMPLAERLVDYFRKTVTPNARRRGANVLIHGAPGLGKTQLARAAAVAAGIEAFEVAACGSDMRPINGDSRLSAYRAAQRLLAHRPSLLIFDEFEDVSDLRSSRKQNPDTVSKGSLNELLETNPVPTVFITNAPQNIDVAHLRRFDLVIEAKAPSHERRRELLRAAAGDYIHDELLEDIIAQRAATTAIVKRATDVVDIIGSDAPTEARRELFCQVLSGTLRMQTHAPVELSPRQKTKDPSALYDPTLSNADIDLGGLAEALKGPDGCRTLLFGPPGTGKTAFGGWLAKQIGAPLLIKRASDLLGRFVGDNEANIAEAFAEARRDKAVLLIDECDSFLGARKDADQQWQRTMTNELLTQMEAFPGVLVMTTNFMENVDEAVMRRLDFKICLDYLTPSQLRTLFVRYCDLLGLGVPSEICLRRAGNLSCVAPGDLAVVARQARLRRLKTPEDLVERLTVETGFKRDSRLSRPMGFLAS